MNYKNVFNSDLKFTVIFIGGLDKNNHITLQENILQRYCKYFILFGNYFHVITTIFLQLPNYRERERGGGGEGLLSYTRKNLTT